MTKLICDITRKEIKNPHRDYNYFAILGKNISAEAKFDLDESVRAAMGRRGHYSFEEYKKVFKATLAKMCS